MFSFQLLSEDYSIEIALVKLHVLVIVVRHDFQPRIVDGPEGEYAVIEIDQVGMIFVYHVHCAVEEVVVVTLRGDRGSFGPVPGVDADTEGQFVFAGRFLPFAQYVSLGAHVDGVP